MEEKHYPPGAEPETPAEVPAPEGDKAPEGEQPKPEGEAEQPKPGEEKAPEAKKPEEEPEPEPEPKLPKKRSIYDDLKDERQKRKDTESRLKELEEELVKARGDKALEQPAPKPEKPADELEAYAEENGIDATSLARLVEIIQKRIPTSNLSDDDKQALSDLKQWRADQARTAEDNELRAQSPMVAKELGITDPAELTKVMDEIVRLAHTKEFHDKETEYILWRNRDALSKLVSPKRPSFEQGGQQGDAAPEKEPDFSTGKVTPEQAQRYQDRPKSSYEIRPAK